MTTFWRKAIINLKCPEIVFNLSWTKLDPIILNGWVFICAKFLLKHFLLGHYYDIAYRVNSARGVTTTKPIPRKEGMIDERIKCFAFSTNVDGSEWLAGSDVFIHLENSTGYIFELNCASCCSRVKKRAEWFPSGTMFCKVDRVNSNFFSMNWIF